MYYEFNFDILAQRTEKKSYYKKMRRKKPICNIDITKARACLFSYNNISYTLNSLLTHTILQYNITSIN